MKINKKAKLADLLKKNPDMTLEDLLESTASGKKKRSKKDGGIKNDKLKELQEEAFNKELEGKTGIVGRLKGGVKGAQKSFELEQEFKTAKTGVKSRYGNIAKAFGADPKSAAMIDRIFGKKVDDKELTKLREKFNLDEKNKPETKENKKAEKKEVAQKDLTDNISKIFDIVKEIRSVVEGIANKLGASSSKEVPTTKKGMRKLAKDSGLKYSKETGRYHDTKTKKMVGFDAARQRMNISPSALKVSGVASASALAAGVGSAAGTETASKVMEGKADTFAAGGPKPATEGQLEKVGKNVGEINEVVDEIKDFFSLKKFYGLIGGAIGAAIPLLIKAGKVLWDLFGKELDFYKKIGSAIWDFLKDMLLEVDFTIPFPKLMGGPIHFAPFSFLKSSSGGTGAEAAPSTPAPAPSTPVSTPSTPVSTPSTPVSTPSTPSTPVSAPTATQAGSNMPAGSPPVKKSGVGGDTVPSGGYPAATDKQTTATPEQNAALEANITKYVNLKDSSIDLASMDPAVKKRLAAVAYEYFNNTGKKIQINSAFRDPKEQAELFAKYGSPRAARPGKSKHEVGLAVDMNSADANQATSMGLFDKYGFKRPIASEPWHVEAKEARNSSPDNPSNPGQAVLVSNGGKPTIPSDGVRVNDNQLKQAAPAAPAAPAGGGTGTTQTASDLPSAGTPTVTPTKAASSVEPTPTNGEAVASATPVASVPSSTPTASPVEAEPTNGQAVASNTTEVVAAKEQMVASNASPAPRISAPVTPQPSPKPPNPDHSVKASARLVEDTFTRALAKDFSHPSAFTTVVMV